MGKGKHSFYCFFAIKQPTKYNDNVGAANLKHRMRWRLGKPVPPCIHMYIHYNLICLTWSSECQLPQRRYCIRPFVSIRATSWTKHIFCTHNLRNSWKGLLSIVPASGQLFFSMQNFLQLYFSPDRFIWAKTFPPHLTWCLNISMSENY